MWYDTGPKYWKLHRENHGKYGTIIYLESFTNVKILE